MRLELSDGNWVEVREVDDLRDADRQAVNRAVQILVEPDGRWLMPGGYQDDRRKVLYARIITNWSFPEVPPSKDSRSIGKLTLGQARELREATQPWLEALDDIATPETPNT